MGLIRDYLREREEAKRQLWLEKSVLWLEDYMESIGRLEEWLRSDEYHYINYMEK